VHPGLESGKVLQMKVKKFWEQNIKGTDGVLGDQKNHGQSGYSKSIFPHQILLHVTSKKCYPIGQKNTQ
jgi:hypothetical protein